MAHEADMSSLQLVRLFWEGLKPAGTAVLVTLLSFWCILIALWHWRTPSTAIAAPRIGKDPRAWGLRHARAHFVRNSKELTMCGYTRFKDSMYWVQTGDMERLVLPNRYVNNLRKLSDTHIDSKAAVVERNLGWYNRVDIVLKSTAHVEVCRTQLVKNLGKLSEVGDTMQFFNASDTMLNIVNQSTAKTLVGEPLCFDQNWLRICLETTVNTGLVCRRLQQLPSLFRSVVCPFTEAKRALDRDFNAAKSILSCQIQSRQAGHQNIDILQWLIDDAKQDELDVPFLTNQILFIAIAATRSTATSIVNILLDLVAHPEYQAELREDIDMGLADANGWGLDAIQRMMKLDSFIKESHRLNHHLLLSFNRKVRKPIHLADVDVTIPAGTFISTPAYWTARDPLLFPPGPDGDAFDPWRWLRLRQAAEREGQSTVPYLASSTSSSNLHWGYGRNACPGRAMAVAEIKLLLAWILKHFEISLPLDQGTCRPDSVFLDERVMPDPKQMIGFRVREIASIAH
ncbi:hypothetical protein SLS53_006654 [Cytospora paraplurivora]|uniref:Cytochrome P450 n=1 Tax=Cytospora paraplurivora TaxID=2898453 RepID=A0AAN9YEK4_9PEZI